MAYSNHLHEIQGLDLTGKNWMPQEIGRLFESTKSDAVAFVAEETAAIEWKGLGQAALSCGRPMLPYPVVWLEFNSISPPGSAVCQLLLSTDEGWEAVYFSRLPATRQPMQGPLLWYEVLQSKEADVDIQFLSHEPKGKNAETERSAKFLVENTLRWLGALACKNVQAVENPPTFTQRRAAAKRKRPIFSTWTLHLKPSGPRADHGGTHASPRVHLRRGHVREYAPGKFTWVQPAVVGRPELGMVHKDYRVDAQDARHAS